jgi:hypothetical protein
MLASPDTSTPIDAEEGYNDNADGFIAINLDVGSRLMILSGLSPCHFFASPRGVKRGRRCAHQQPLGH